MKKYNEKLIQASAKIASNSLKKSKATVERLTNPSRKVAQIGHRIGSLVGVIFIILGIFKLLLGEGIWAISSVVVGIITIISNIISSKN